MAEDRRPAYNSTYPKVTVQWVQKLGTPIDDFDLLIGVTSVYHNLAMVTNNTKHFKGIKNIKIEDWITEK